MINDLRHKWLNWARFMQAGACKNHGLAIVSSQVLIDDKGDPITWTEPQVTRLGPLSSQDTMIRLLSAHADRWSGGTDFLIAQVIDGRKIVINRGENAGVGKSDWFVYIDKDEPYAILSVNELREKIAILTTIWVDRREISPIAIGDSIYRLRW